MIPLHRSAFGLGTVIGRSLFPAAAGRNLQKLEEACAEITGCAEAVWLPSARAGICWALRASIGNETKVVGPAFTCSVVHEAMVRSGGNVQLIDADCATFGMEVNSLKSAQTGNHALVLSEPYGHAYDLEQLARNTTSPATIRIVDMALAVPHRSAFQRLQSNDFAVVSFGDGKTAYAGWGGMGVTQDRALAKEVRKLRDVSVGHGGVRLQLKRTAKINLRTAAHYPLVYSLTRKMWYQAVAARSFLRRNRQGKQTSLTQSPSQNFGFPANWSNESSRGVEWTLSSTSLDRSLALWNLEHAAPVREIRLALARRYHENLVRADGIIIPPASTQALSHYTVRVDANIRNLVKDQLCRRGVYTISLWTFCPYLDAQEFPNAFRLCSEVVNLPLSPWMNLSQVDRVCELLMQQVAACSAKTHPVT